MYKVSSEIYKETNFQTVSSGDGKVLSKFKFCYPNDNEEEAENAQSTDKVTVDKDGDLLVKRKRPSGASVSRTGQILIEHSEATEIKLVGLQVWRGSLLLADYIFHCRKQFKDKQLLELGAGVGLTSIAAAIYVKQVVCTDVDMGGILQLIRNNVKHNSQLLAGRGNVHVLECDFMQSPQAYSHALLHAIDESDIVLAADVIYDDELTNAFIRVIDNIFERERVSGRRKTVYLAMEKRFVFTLSELDAVAPMFEHFLKQSMHKTWRFEYVPADFPQYFEYERCKHLVLLKLTSGAKK